MLVFIFKLIRLKVRQIMKHLTRLVYCRKMAQSMILQQKCMEVDLDLDMIGSEMIELLGGLKQQSADQPDQNSFYDNKNTQEKSKKRKKQPQQRQEQGQITVKQHPKPEDF